jgi:hypothetical protein
MTKSKMVSGTIIGTFAVLSMTNVATVEAHEGAGLTVPTGADMTVTLPMLFGSVHADCKPINVGTGGWSCKKTAKGVYQLKLYPTLPRAPVCQAAPTGQQSAGYESDNVFTTYYITKRGFMVASRDVDRKAEHGSTPQDASFNFMCMWMP